MRNQTKENRARRILAKILAGLPGLAGWEPEERVRLKALENTPNDLERKRYAYAL